MSLASLKRVVRYLHVKACFVFLIQATLAKSKLQTTDKPNKNAERERLIFSVVDPFTCLNYKHNLFGKKRGEEPTKSLCCFETRAYWKAHTARTHCVFEYFIHTLNRRISRVCALLQNCTHCCRGLTNWFCLRRPPICWGGWLLSFEISRRTPTTSTFYIFATSFTHTRAISLSVVTCDYADADGLLTVAWFINVLLYPKVATS